MPLFVGLARMEVYKDSAFSVLGGDNLNDATRKLCTSSSRHALIGDAEQPEILLKSRIGANFQGAEVANEIDS